MLHMTIVTLSSIILGLFFVYLSMNVSMLRNKHNIALGDGGINELRRAIRAHGNFSEFVPLNLLLMFLLAFYELNTYMLGLLAITLLISRFAHAYGMLILEAKKKKDMRARMVGTLLNHAYMALCCLCLLYLLYFT